MYQIAIKIQLSNNNVKNRTGDLQDDKIFILKWHAISLNYQIKILGNYGTLPSSKIIILRMYHIIMYSITSFSLVILVRAVIAGGSLKSPMPAPTRIWEPGDA